MEDDHESPLLYVLANRLFNELAGGDKKLGEYPRYIQLHWKEEARNAIGIYEIVKDVMDSVQS